METLTAVVDGETLTWTERRLVVRSPNQGETADKALLVRLAKAQATLAALNERGEARSASPRWNASAR